LKQQRKTTKAENRETSTILGVLWEAQDLQLYEFSKADQ